MSETLSFVRADDTPLVSSVERHEQRERAAAEALAAADRASLAERERRN